MLLSATYRLHWPRIEVCYIQKNPSSQQLSHGHLGKRLPSILGDRIYPDGHYNLVAIGKRTRYPEVEVTYSTSFKPSQVKLKRMFGHHGTPQRIDSDNGPPFHSQEFAQFAEQEGFAHHRVTPEHPRANKIC